MVSSGVDESFDPSLFSIYTVAVNDEKVEELENNIYQLIQEIATNGVTAEELQKVKNKREMNFYEQIATINGKSNNLGTYEVFFGDYKKMFDAPTLFQKVTSDDIKRVAAQYLKKRNRNVVIMQKNVD